jgi:hypothetical protein
MNPATRVDNTIIFEGGFSRDLTLAERLLLWLGKRLNADVRLRKCP